jgi:hypothetical protein
MTRNACQGELVHCTLRHLHTTVLREEPPSGDKAGSLNAHCGPRLVMWHLVLTSPFLPIMASMMQCTSDTSSTRSTSRLTMSSALPASICE